MAARFMRQDLFEFTPRCKVWLAVNERPSVTGTSGAIWARLKEIRFPVVFRDADDPRPEVQHQPVKDPQLEEELLRDALPAVLAWAVAGCLEWQRQGLGEPPEVREAVAEYRQSQDRLAPFLADHPVVERARLRDAFKTWAAWCAEVGEKPGRQADLAAAFRAHGHEVRRSTAVPSMYPAESSSPAE
jgi:putative DNA primase/helicase